jgi:hypothetical protein
VGRLQGEPEGGRGGGQGLHELLAGHAQLVDLGLVEAFRVLPHRIVAPLAHLGQDLPHGVDGRRSGGGGAGQAGAEVAAHTSASTAEVEAAQHAVDGTGAAARAPVG